MENSEEKTAKQDEQSVQQLDGSDLLENIGGAGATTITNPHGLCDLQFVCPDCTGKVKIDTKNKLATGNYTKYWECYVCKSPNVSTFEFKRHDVIPNSVHGATFTQEEIKKHFTK
jgi:hypothetical protein